MSETIFKKTKVAGSGRKKGTPNKRTKLLTEIFEDKGFNVAEELVEILPHLDLEKQAHILLSLMNYVYPKRKSIEIIEEKPKQEPLEIIFIEPSMTREEADERERKKNLGL